MTEANYKTEFRSDYAPPLVLLCTLQRAGWTDASGRNTGCPSWKKGDWRLWVDHEDPQKRAAGPNSERFALWSDRGERFVARSEDLAEALGWAEGRMWEKYATQFSPEYWPRPWLLHLLKKYGWTDDSYRHDVCPKFIKGDLVLWVDHERPGLREPKGCKRYTLSRNGIKVGDSDREGDAEDWVSRNEANTPTSGATTPSSPGSETTMSTIVNCIESLAEKSQAAFQRLQKKVEQLKEDKKREAEERQAAEDAVKPLAAVLAETLYAVAGFEVCWPGVNGPTEVVLEPQSGTGDTDFGFCATTYVKVMCRPAGRVPMGPLACFRVCRNTSGEVNILMGTDGGTAITVEGALAVAEAEVAKRLSV